MNKIDLSDTHRYIGPKCDTNEFEIPYFYRLYAQPKYGPPAHDPSPQMGLLIMAPKCET